MCVTAQDIPKVAQVASENSEAGRALTNSLPGCAKKRPSVPSKVKESKYQRDRRRGNIIINQKVY